MHCFSVSDTGVNKFVHPQMVYGCNPILGLQQDFPKWELRHNNKSLSSFFSLPIFCNAFHADVSNWYIDGNSGNAFYIRVGSLSKDTANYRNGIGESTNTNSEGTAKKSRRSKRKLNWTPKELRHDEQRTNQEKRVLFLSRTSRELTAFKYRRF